MARCTIQSQCLKVITTEQRETTQKLRNNTPEDKEHKMKALDGYIKELGGDITQLIGDMTAEERNLMRTKLSTLVSKL